MVRKPEVGRVWRRPAPSKEAPVNEEDEEGAEFDGPLILQPGEYIHREDRLRNGERRIIIRRWDVTYRPDLSDPRATCRFCGRDMSVRTNGRIRGHVSRLPNADGKYARYCIGSGQPPLEAE